MLLVYCMEADNPDLAKGVRFVPAGVWVHDGEKYSVGFLPAFAAREKEAREQAERATVPPEEMFEYLRQQGGLYTRSFSQTIYTNVFDSASACIKSVLGEMALEKLKSDWKESSEQALEK